MIGVDFGLRGLGDVNMRYARVVKFQSLSDLRTSSGFNAVGGARKTLVIVSVASFVSLRGSVLNSCHIRVEKNEVRKDGSGSA